MTSARDKLPTRQNKDEDDEAYLARCYRSIEDSIAKAKLAIETETITLSEEKRLVGQYERELLKKHDVDEYQQRLADYKVYKQFEKDLRVEFEKRKAELDSLSGGEDKHTAVMKETKQLIAANDEKIKAILKERKELKAEINSLKKEHAAKKAVLDQMWAEWKEEQKVKRAAQQAERKQRDKNLAEKKKMEKLLKPRTRRSLPCATLSPHT
eukprot:TRINITY_DN11453_c0_g1_i1.p2 TRINITY_DN11453_c0_g1~~TRINITY_DN11453_c0_g1_i1.p2  ORF type:complete len:211 (-),score=75.35 TRINITY_DN11453_c0_g1_i1:170-802(-)